MPKRLLSKFNISKDNDRDIQISIADNGCGMTKEELLNGMKYGSKEKNDPRRLGKFGMGMKTASTAFCKKLTVITTTGNNTFHKAIWDLEHVVIAKEWELLLGQPDEYEKSQISELSDATSGTLVLWDGVDRLMKAYANPIGTHARKALKK